MLRGRVATRGTCRRSHSGLRAAMRVLERSAQPGDTRGASFECRPPVVFRPTVTRRKPGSTGGVTTHSRACSGFISIRQTAGGVPRESAQSVGRRRSELRGARSSFTRAPHEAGLELGNGWPPRGALAARAPGASDAARASTKPEEDAGAVTRPGGRSGQHAVKRAAHARWVIRQADHRGENPGAL